MRKHQNGTQVVWFKRDLRTHDHAPLYEASKAGPVYCLFVYETPWLESAEFDPIHLQAVNESLDDLQLALERPGGQLVRRFGDAVAVLDELHARFGVAGLWSHEETGLDWSYLHVVVCTGFVATNRPEKRRVRFTKSTAAAGGPGKLPDKRYLFTATHPLICGLAAGV